MTTVQLGSTNCRKGTIAACGTKCDFSNGVPIQSRIFSLFDENGYEVRCLMTAGSGFDFEAQTFDELKNYFIDGGAWTIDSRGWVYHAPQYDRYVVEVHDSAGNLRQVIERDFESYVRSSKDKERLTSKVVMTVGDEVVQLDSDFQDRNPAIIRIESPRDGEIWIENGYDSEYLPEGIARAYDVFDQDGHFRKAVNLAYEMNFDQDKLICLTDGRWIALRNLQGAIESMHNS